MSSASLSGRDVSNGLSRRCSSKSEMIFAIFFSLSTAICSVSLARFSASCYSCRWVVRIRSATSSAVTIVFGLRFFGHLAAPSASRVGKALAPALGGRSGRIGRPEMAADPE